MAKDSKKKEKKEKKENKTFFKDFKAELKKVTWPTAKQLANKTAVVIAIVLIISAIVFVLDSAFGKGYEFIVTKASNAINRNQTITTTVDENQTDSTSTEENVTTEEVDSASDVVLDANTTTDTTSTDTTDGETAE